MAVPPDLYLASKSPRRRDLLTQAGLRFASCEPGEEYAVGGSEHVSERGEPRALATMRAQRKVMGAAIVLPGVPILAVDTVVDLDGEELGKATDGAAAEMLLLRLAGHEHQVHTAHCVVVPGSGMVLQELSSAVVACLPPTAAQLQRYLESEQWRGKAGAYGIQDSAQDFLSLVAGSFDTVVGLHVPAVQRLLQAAREQA